MQTCLDFSIQSILGDPIIPDEIYYKDDIGDPMPDPNDTRTRRQNPWPGAGTQYIDLYDTLAQSYVLSVVPGSFSIEFGVDVIDTTPYPSQDSEADTSSISLIKDKTLINYNITWNKSTPYDYNNPPIIYSSEFSDGMNLYWSGVTINDSLNFDELNDLQEDITVTYTYDYNISTNIKLFMDTNNIGPSDHESLCNEIKKEVLNIRISIEESYIDSAEVVGEDTHVLINYQLQLVEI